VNKHLLPIYSAINNQLDPRYAYRAIPKMKILVTGAAGFIGHHLAMRLLQRGDSVVGHSAPHVYNDASQRWATGCPPYNWADLT
jgi:hypothetical protein